MQNEGITCMSAHVSAEAVQLWVQILFSSTVQSLSIRTVNMLNDDQKMHVPLQGCWPVVSRGFPVPVCHVPAKCLHALKCICNGLSCKAVCEQDLCGVLSLI
jgi:hypothetical protein